MIKSFEEIKNILKRNKNAAGVGFVITPELLKIAVQVGLMGYDHALSAWFTKSVFLGATKPEEVNKNAEQGNSLMVAWEGASLAIDSRGNIRVGIKRTIEDIELLI